MEDQCSPLGWAYYYQEEGIEELKNSLFYTTLELKSTILTAHEEIARKDDELMHLKQVLSNTIKERDEAQENCQKLMFEKLLVQQQLQQFQQQQQQHIEAAAALIKTTNTTTTTTTTNEEEPEPRRGDSSIAISSSDCDENVATSPGMDQIAQPTLVPFLHEVTDKLALKKPLPEKGKFLQAVMEAGPLLQTLMLAGPLPQWEHPPPQLNSIEIPPVTIPSPRPQLLHQDSCISSNSGCFSKKRLMVHTDAYDSSPNNSNKYQKVVHQSSLTNI